MLLEVKQKLGHHWKGETPRKIAFSPDTVIDFFSRKGPNYVPNPKGTTTVEALE